MARRNMRIQIMVDKNFYDFLKKSRQEISAKLPVPIKSDIQFTAMLLNKNLIDFKPPRLKLRRKNVF